MMNKAKKHKAGHESEKYNQVDSFMMASQKTLSRIWKDEPAGLWKSYL